MQVVKNSIEIVNTITRDVEERISLSFIKPKNTVDINSSTKCRNEDTNKPELAKKLLGIATPIFKSRNSTIYPKI